MKASTLKVPGATLYYEIRGSGPLLLIIPGGPQDAGVFAELSRRLADRYRVVAFDPRGTSRSPFDGPARPLSVDEHADDAAALIGALGGGPVEVFGTSGGAQVGLSLAARYPALVSALVTHEPPTIALLDDPAPALAAARGLHEVYRVHGVEAAMGKFFADNGLMDEAGSADGAREADPDPEATETFARVGRNFEYWLAHGLIPLSAYRPDIETLRRGGPRIIVAIGEASAGQPIAEMGSALARALDVEPILVPGDHMGFETLPEQFAAALDHALRASRLAGRR
jgi:pimeloyl-ACP methyl ester carboxylesterase